MTKEMLALVALGVTLVGAVFGFGMRIGTLTERIDTQSKQIELLTAELRAVNQHFIAYSLLHRDTPAQ